MVYPGSLSDVVSSDGVEVAVERTLAVGVGADVVVLRTGVAADHFGAPYAIWSIPYVGKTRQMTQDFRLTSTGDAALRYILGAYYQHEVIFNSTENEIFTDPAFNTFNDYRDCAASSFTPGGRCSVVKKPVPHVPCRSGWPSARRGGV